MMDTQLRIVAYRRVSTPEQATSGYGLDAQADSIATWADATGHHIVATKTDAGLSGDLDAPHRPDLAEALAMIDGGDADGLVVTSLDRIARTLTVQEATLARVWSGPNRHVFLVTGEVPRDDPDDPYRTAMRQMAGVFAQLEKAQLLLRMRNGRRAKARQGGFAYGSPPFGYRVVDSALVPDKAEQATLARMNALRTSGSTTRSIAATLNEEGRLTKRGRPWTSSSVSDALTSGRVAMRKKVA
jgi:DNA invertase Pin-like site-specific DNA recombinase